MQNWKTNDITASSSTKCSASLELASRCISSRAHMSGCQKTPSSNTRLNVLIAASGSTSRSVLLPRPQICCVGSVTHTSQAKRCVNCTSWLDGREDKLHWSLKPNFSVVIVSLGQARTSLGPRLQPQSLDCACVLICICILSFSFSLATGAPYPFVYGGKLVLYLIHGICIPLDMLSSIAFASWLCCTYPVEYTCWYVAQLFW